MKIRNLALMAVTGFGLLASGTPAFAEEHWHRDHDRDRHEYREDHERRDRDQDRRGWDHDRNRDNYRDHRGYDGGYASGYYANPYYEAPSPYYAPAYGPPPVVVRPYRPGFGIYFGVR